MSESNGRAPSIASALVIGVGGSGVHTLARLQSAVRDTSRPGVVAIDNIRFLAIDAVEQNDQLPALPPNTGLEPSEFFDIASTPLNAYNYVSQAWGHDETLRSSWDTDYIPPNQPLTDGMKRSRPLGNLVFRVQGQQLTARLRTALNEVVQLNPEQYRKGSEGSRARVPVFIVASSAGGTGSSGFLHVLHAIHRAAHAAGVALSVYPIIFLPDVFASARVGSMNPQMEERAHKSNAYAFFSELDYVISEPGAFDRLLCPSDELSTDVQAMDVVENVFVIDGKLTDGRQIRQEDAYDLAAAALHSLLLTKVQSLLGAAGTNTDNKGYDALKPPQRTAYAALGSRRTVFPGSTYRRYAKARLRSHLLGSYLLDESAQTNEQERGRRVVTSLVERIWGLQTLFDEKARALRSVQDLLTRAANAGADLDDKDVAQAVVDHAAAVRSDGERAAEDLVDVLPAQTRAAIGQLPEVIDEVIRDSGEGLKVLRYAVGKAQLALSEKAEEARKYNASARQSLSNLQQQDREGSLPHHVRRVQQAATRNFLVRRGEVSESVKGYCDAVTQYADKLLKAHVEQARLDIAKQAVEQLKAVSNALESASKVLREEKDHYDELWQNDDLVGKDAGSQALTALIPSDVLPNVDTSAVATAIWARIEKHLASFPELGRDPREAVGGVPTAGREWVRRVCEKWWDEGASNGVRGLVSLGQGDRDAVAQTRSREILDKVLGHEIEVLGDLAAIMPADLASAASLADAVVAGDVLADESEASRVTGEQTRQLWQALDETMKGSGDVALQIDPAKIKLQGGTPLPSPVVKVMGTGDMLTHVRTLLPDAELIDSTDPEQVMTLAVQRGFPISAVKGLDLWLRAHRSVMRDRASYGSKSIDPPPFLDVNFELNTRARPLVRRLYSEADVAELVVQATVLMRLAQPPGNEAIRAMGLVSPLRLAKQGNKMAVYGTPLAIRDGRVLANGDETLLGTWVGEVFDALAKQAGLQQGITAVFDFLLTKAQNSGAGDTALRDALSNEIIEYRQQNMELVERLPRDNPSEATERELEVRLAMDAAAELVLSEVLAPTRPVGPLIV